MQILKVQTSPTPRSKGGTPRKVGIFQSVQFRPA